MITATIAPVERRYELVPDGETGVIVDRMLDEPVAEPRPVAHALATAEAASPLAKRMVGGSRLARDGRLSTPPR